MKILDVPQSGSVAAVTSSRNRFGQYRRSRRAPVNPNTTAQQAARSALSAASVAYRGLTDLQRAAWAAFSNAHPRTDSLGQSITLSGFQYFVGVYCSMVAANFTPAENPPGGVDLGRSGLNVEAVTHTDLEVTATEEGIDATVLLFASPPLSAGRTFNNDFRLVAVTANPEAGDDILTAAQLAAKFGTLRAGMKFFLKTRIVNLAGDIGPDDTTTIVLT